MDTTPPVRLMINTPAGLFPLDDLRSRTLMPRGPDLQEPALAYGPYLKALAALLCRNSCEFLLTAVSKLLDRETPVEEVDSVDIISVKHGALYNVAQVRAHLRNGSCTLAANVAATAEQQAVLEQDFSLLSALRKHFGHAFLPRPFVMGQTEYSPGKPNARTLSVFLAEWFEGYHEFHLTRGEGGTHPSLVLWDQEEGRSILDEEQSLALYRKASYILTSYFDVHTFRQIHPWHHAAGDFIVKVHGREVDAKLITVRGYRSMLPPGTESADSLVAMVHFFLNLTLRMRLDRLDGTGELAWAGPDSLDGVVEGFLRAWRMKNAKDPDAPPVEEVMELLCSFSPKEWYSMGEIILEGGLVEEEESDFIAARLQEHAAAVAAAVDRTTAYLKRFK